MSTSSYRAVRRLAHAVVAGTISARALAGQEASVPIDAVADTASADLSLPVSARVTWRPELPLPGALIELAVRLATPDDSVASVESSFAGEPLHFGWDGQDAFRALAGIPIEWQDSVLVMVVLTRPASVDTLTLRIRLGPDSYPSEQLRVAPEFGRQPDSALAARLLAETRRAQAVSERAHRTPRLWREAFLRPRPGRVTSSFGRRREFNGALRSRHLGTDFAGKIGSPVRAANRGIVALVDDFYLGGKVVYLDHGEGLVTAYFHLSRSQVAEGEMVTRGQVIARVGATGRVTGPHLHWVARYGRVSVDPLSLLELGTSPPKRQPTEEVDDGQ
jgi:murein DD-endopeptidase MepM/ murein hydrolase activator NlpD